MTVPRSRNVTPRLPASARARLTRFEDATAHPSYLSVPSAFGLAASGFDAVGDVMGCIAFQVTNAYLGRCGSFRGASNPKVVFAGSAGSTRTSYTRQLQGAYATALNRLGQEASVLGADGVLGIELTMRVHETLHELVAVGTAVRSRGRTHPPRPFTTDLAGIDVAKLVQTGWTPISLHAVVQIGLRHNDPVTLARAGAGPGALSNRGRNVEVPGYTQTRQRVVESVRGLLAAAGRRAGADGTLLSSLDVTTWSTECSPLEGRDHVVKAVAIATSVARFATTRPLETRTLTILPVTRRNS